MLSALLLASLLPTYSIQQYDTNDGGILWSLTGNGKWATVRVGSESAGGYATPKLYDVEAGQAFEVRYTDAALGYDDALIDVRSVTPDGRLVVGSLQGIPVAYDRTSGQLTRFALRDDWEYGMLTSVTDDGQWAVGYYNSYLGVFDADGELTGDYYFSPLMVNVATGDTLSLAGLPKLDMAHLDQHALVLDQVTPDGRYAIGRMDWYIMEPRSGFVFVYDRLEQRSQVIGFTPSDHAEWQPLAGAEHLHHIEGAVLSPNGRYLAGDAYMAKPQEGSEFFNEYSIPFRYDMQLGTFTLFDQPEARNVGVGAVTDQGTIFGNPDTGSPLRNFRILHADTYWISFAQICQQYYGFDFPKRTGYEFTGTVVGASADGSRIASFPDPTGESYIFDFGQPIDEVCSQIDLLDNYSVSPLADAAFSLLTDIEVNFGRNIQIVGNGRNVHLCRADGTVVTDGLSNGGLSLKTGSHTSAVASFRPRLLEDGVQYYVVIDAEAIALASDSKRTNRTIRIPYRGRADAPMQLVKATPADHATLRQIDNASSYIVLDFDAPILTTDKCLAYIERVSDGSRLATMIASAGIQSDTRHQLLLTPPTSLYLFSGEEYRLILEAGSVCDLAGNESSLNERITLLYHGSYVREVTNERILFADDFNQPITSMSTWILYDGDKLTPVDQMTEFEFVADGMPWNFSMRDSISSGNSFAGAHSLYTNGGASDDWMFTPQLSLPADFKSVLEFDAQSYDPLKTDVLKVYVYESSSVFDYISSSRMRIIKRDAVLLDSITLNAGQHAETTEGEWTHYVCDLSPWAGRDIYIGFANHNQQQSLTFIDNVVVQRDVLCMFGFTSRDRVVDQPSIIIAGQFTNMSPDTQGTTTLTLRNAAGQDISTLRWDYIPERGTPVPFAFTEPLPLSVGAEVSYSIQAQIGSLSDTYQGTIVDLAFEPTRRVVLEEMTGTTCINCPLGKVAIQQCQRAFGDRFIPVAIHSYDGDRLGTGMKEYSDFLGLIAAPSARINRRPIAYAPMAYSNGDYQYTLVEGQDLWYDVVAAELDRLPIANLELNAMFSADSTELVLTPQLRYAISAANQQLSLLVVITEDNVSAFQRNTFSRIESVTLADWCGSGPYAQDLVMGYLHQHVARSVIGQTYGGTIGLFPAEIQSGQTYSSQFKAPAPENRLSTDHLSAVAILIDAVTGEVINAAQAPVTAFDPSLLGIEAIHADGSAQDDASGVLRTMAGTIISFDATDATLQHLAPGLYLLGSRKVMVR